ALKDVRMDANNPMIVGLPNGSTISSVGTGTLGIKGLPNIPAHIFHDENLDRSLVSLSDYTNRGCTTQLTATDLTVHPNGETVLVGVKRPSEKLWGMIIDRDTLDLQRVFQSPAHFGGEKLGTMYAAEVDTSLAMGASMSNMVSHQYDAEFVSYVHACFGS